MDEHPNREKQEEATILIGSPPPRLRPLRPGETPADLAAEIGLTRCPTCGEFKGACSTEDGDVELLCICDGIACRRCKRVAVRRPISDHFDEGDGRIWHTPYFMGMVPCAECREELKPKGATCTICGSTETLPIVYGLPGPGLAERARLGQVRLGGCVIDPGAPNWFCRYCGGEFTERKV